MAEFVPTEIVKKLASAGKSEKEIVAQLRLQGFTPAQIDSALKEAIKVEVVGPQPLGLGNETIPEGPPPAPRGRPSPEISAAARAPPATRHPVSERAIQQIPQQPMPGPMGEPPEKIKTPVELKPVEVRPQAFANPQPIEIPSADISLEELVEAIVSERWIKFEEKLSIFDKRDLVLQQQIQELKIQIDKLRSEKREEEKVFIEKLEEFGTGIEKTQSRIGSIESAFREFVPTLAENVRALSGVVEKIKKSK